MTINWLREAINDNESGVASAKRLGLLVATSALSLSVTILAIAACFGHDVAMALGAVAVPLAGMNGYSYVGGITAEKKP